jgi:YesN/AraC family two-component response regulator
MIAIAVDHEALMLGALVTAVEASADISEVTSFSDCEEALEFVKNNPTDVAFLDINMRGMGGLALAEKIVALKPNCKIVFCTGYEEYAIPAFKLHASGYLMKPISAEDVQVEIDNIGIGLLGHINNSLNGIRLNPVIRVGKEHILTLGMLKTRLTSLRQTHIGLVYNDYSVAKMRIFRLNQLLQHLH